MKYGVVCAISHGGTSSMAGFSRADREYTDAEIEQLQAYVEALHIQTADQAQLSPETIKQLKNMSVMVTHPGS